MSMPAFATPGQLNGLTLKHRLLKAGTFEGMTPHGEPGDRLQAFHRRLAEGGIAMTTLGYCAVEADGRLHEHMMHMHEAIRAPLTALIDELHTAGTRVSGQMGHCGGFSKNRQLQRRRPQGPHFGLNLLGAAQGMVFCDAMSERDIHAMIRAYGEAAAFMKSVGFDCLEIHFGHGYGLCQFISPRTNRRQDAWGGSLDKRMRLPLAVLEAVRKAVGETFPVIGKISLMEGVKGGIEPDEAVEIARYLDRGGIDGIVTSGGTSTMNPGIMFRGGNLMKPLARAERNPLMKAMIHLVGPRLFRDYPYEELYFLDHARRVRDAVACRMIYVGGASTGESFARLLQEGFDFIQLGRTLLADPDLPARVLSDPAFKSRCLHCNECVATIEHPAGIHCTRF